MQLTKQQNSFTFFSAPKNQIYQGFVNKERITFTATPTSTFDIQQRSGSCGFNSLNTTRESVSEILLANRDRLEVKNLIAEQIRNDYQIAKEDLYLSIDNWNLLDQLQEQVNNKKIERNKTIEHYSQLAQLKDPNEDELILFFNKRNTSVAKQAVMKLTRIKIELQQSQDDLDNFLTSERLIIDYIKQNIKDQWLGTYVALAWAKVTNTTLRFWTHRNQQLNSTDIYLLPSLHYQAIATEQPEIDILHTDQGSHFERLNILTRQISEQEQIHLSKAFKI